MAAVCTENLSSGVVVVKSAKMLELRASAALARLWVRCGERKKALDVLTPIYDWFTQGFDTPDLRRARTMLGELRPSQH